MSNPVHGFVVHSPNSSVILEGWSGLVVGKFLDSIRYEQMSIESGGSVPVVDSQTPIVLSHTGHKSVKEFYLQFYSAI